MFNLKRFFFPYDKFSLAILTAVRLDGDGAFFKDLWKYLSTKPDLPEVPIGKLDLALERMVNRGLLTKTRFVRHDIVKSILYKLYSPFYIFFI